MSRPICPFLAMDISEMDISEMVAIRYPNSDMSISDILIFRHTTLFTRSPCFVPYHTTEN
jgi:hypothetical protein